MCVASLVNYRDLGLVVTVIMISSSHTVTQWHFLSSFRKMVLKYFNISNYILK